MTERQMRDYFVKTAQDALEHFEVMPGSNWDGPTRFIHAEAGTGSRYEVYSQPAGSDHAGCWLITVRQPFVGAYEFQRDGLLHPTFFLEKVGNRGRNLLDYNGGDTYALLECVRKLIGRPYPDPTELFRMES